MYQTISTETYFVQGGVVDIHTVRTENGYHWDAAIWLGGHCTDAKGGFASRFEAMKWAYWQVGAPAAEVA